MFRTKPYKLAALREWNTRMSRLSSPEIFDPVVAHVLRSQGFDPREDKYYEPRSVYSVEKLYQQLEGFDPAKPVFVDGSDRHVQRGVSFAYKLFAKPRGKSKLETLPYYDESIISNWEGSSGLTAYGLTKRQAYSRGLLSAERILEGRRVPEPCLAFARTQKQGKTRLIWGYPYSMTILEGMVAKPLLNEFKGGTTPMAFAMTNRAMGMKILAASNNNKYWYSLDASQFDATISAFCIRTAFNIIRTWFDMDAPVYEEVTCGELMDIIERYFINTPIVMPTGENDVRGQGILHLGKKHGVPSGSYFTQLVDSIVNVIILGTLCSKFGFTVDEEAIFVLGDDLLFFTNTHLNIRSMARYASETFSMVFNQAKSTHGRADEPVEFLGRLWCRGVPVRSTIKAIQKMLYPEKRRDLGEDYQEKRKNAETVVLSYSLSACQDVRLIPNLIGWWSYISGFRLTANSDNLSGFLRYKMRYLEKPLKNNGGTNVLRVLL